MMKKRDTWSSKLGIVMAVAASAVGLGNFLRFPVVAVQNGAGAFMIPYFIAIILLAIPLCWIEWSMGRLAGSKGHGSGPGIFNTFHHSSFSRYFGALGIFIPICIYMYYVYIESWCLGYSIFSITGDLTEAVSLSKGAEFLSSYQGLSESQWFDSMKTAYILFLVTFSVNIYIVYKGVSGGIEILSKLALPLLVFVGILLALRVLTLGTPDPAHPDWNVSNGFGFMWNPDFSTLLDSKIWLAATGQVFFTTSVGLGLIITYASYLKPDDDVALSSLTSLSMNEFIEVIIGGAIAIPATFIFFGAVEAVEIAKSGAFNLGFVTMPEVFGKLPFSSVLSFLWFGLLFLAGVTSSVSMLQPGISFLEDELGFNRKKSVAIISLLTFLGAHIPVLLLSKGGVDLFDFWVGTFGIILFATVEVILFGWFFGVDEGIKELKRNSSIGIPSVFRFVIKYLTPLYLIVVLTVWMFQDAAKYIPSPKSENFYYELFIIGSLFSIMAILLIAVKMAFKKGAFKKGNNL